MAEVSLTGVRKRFGQTQVIHGIDVAIADGELVVIVGPSGCGKSTLLRLVAGLEEVSDGEIAIGGRVVNQLEPKDRDIAMVFQNYALYPHMSVYGNMSYGLRIQKMSRAEIDSRVQKAADILELGGLLDRKPRQLSGGQRQRVAMGRAIVREPAVFLFDEPLSNLDAKLRVQMRIEIKRLQRRLATTSIYVTHDQVEAMTLADRLIVMNEGVAEQIGTPLAVYERPATVFVAGFIGSPAMNFLQARLSDGGRAVTLGGGLKLPLPAACDVGEGRPVTLGIRPEHIALAPAGETDLDILIDLVEPLGADTLVHGRLDGSDAELTARLPGNAPVAAGEALPVAVDRARLHLFDADSGARLAG
jgi:sn-glycerol 3-phosphate transport system ATP-binding protein